MANESWKILPAYQGTSGLQRKLNKQLADEAWGLYLQSVPQRLIAKRLGVAESTISKWIARKQDAHPAADWNQGRMNVDSFCSFQTAGLEIRQEIAAYRGRGEPVPAPLLSMLSTHADRFARWATRQSAVPVVEASVNFNSELWAGLMGAQAVPAAPLADAAVGVEVLPAGDAHSNGAEPSPGVTALHTDTPAS